MERTDSQSQWDAKRFVQEFLKMADLIKYYQGKPFGDMAWSKQIRIKRLASVLRAFLGMNGVEEEPVDLITSVFDGWHYEELFNNSPIREEDHAKLMALVKQTMNDDHRYDSLMRTYDTFSGVPSRLDWKNFHDRRYMLLKNWTNGIVIIGEIVVLNPQIISFYPRLLFYFVRF